MKAVKCIVPSCTKERDPYKTLCYDHMEEYRDSCIDELTKFGSCKVFPGKWFDKAYGTSLAKE